MTKFVKMTLIAGAATLAVLQGESKAAAPQICSGFSEATEHREPPLSWRFRSCTTTVGKREIHVQFHNRSDRPLTFEFRLWTSAQKNCRTEDEPAAQGIRSLAAHQTEEWPYTVSTLDDGDAFNGRIWICVKGVAS